MATQKKTHEIRIAGVPLKIRSNHDEEMVSQMVEFVDAKVNEALASNRNGSFQDSTLLACLNLAEQYLLLKKNALSELQRLESKTQSVISHLEVSREGLNL